MSREDYLRLAASGLRMPVGTDLVLREREDAEKVLLDGKQLGEVVAAAARRYRTPLAVPVMDLAVEKAAMLSAIGIPADRVDTFHFDKCPGAAIIEKVKSLDVLSHPRVRANVDSIKAVSRDTSIVPIGMVIGPFSLATKLLDDPITAAFIAGSGVTAEEDDEVKRLEVILDLSQTIVLKSARAQIAGGAKAIFVCEPAANKVYFSPNQLEGGSDVFNRYVMRHNRQLAETIRAGGADLIFHCCGELTDSMVKDFASLDPVMLSLGSSRKLWEDAALVPKNIVLYGNLPSKKFYSDTLINEDQVKEQSRNLLSKMRDAKHPFILGSECDVLCVAESKDTIKRKVEAMIYCQ